MVLGVCVGFSPIDLCVLTVWASIRDLAFIRSFTVLSNINTVIRVKRHEKEKKEQKYEYIIVIWVFVEWAISTRLFVSKTESEYAAA